MIKRKHTKIKLLAIYLFKCVFSFIYKETVLSLLFRDMLTYNMVAMMSLIKNLGHFLRSCRTLRAKILAIATPQVQHLL